MHRRRREAEDERAPSRTEGSRGSPDNAVIALQRQAGNAAVTRLLQRDDAPGFTPVRPGSPLSMRPPPNVWKPEVRAPVEHEAAIAAVSSWFRAAAAEITSGRSVGFVQSVPELVKAARELEWKADGKTGKVADQMSPGEVETLLRAEAKERGVRLLEHR